MVNQWQEKAKQRQKTYKYWLKKVKPKKVYALQQTIHEEVVHKTNCLDCAECCKNYSPRFKTTDIKRISKYLKLKESVFIDTYLNLDEEGDFVLKQTPCSFLNNDNTCSIYDVRPSDCARFPYTDEDVLIKRPALTLKNISFCPIVYQVVEKLMENIGE